MAQVPLVNVNSLYRAGATGARITRAKAEQFNQNRQNIASSLSSVFNAVKTVKEKSDKLEALKAEFPEGIKREFINPAVREKLTSYISSEKDAYNANIKIMKNSPSFSKKYKQAVEENNKIKDGMAKVNDDLMYAYNSGQKAEGIKVSGGANMKERDDNNDLALGTIWDRGFQITRDGVNIEDMETAQDSMGENIYKPITDIKPGSQASRAGNDGVSKLLNNMLEDGYKGRGMGVGMPELKKKELDNFLDSLSDSEMKDFYFSGMDGDSQNKSSGAWVKLASMGNKSKDADGNPIPFQRMDLPDPDVDPDGYRFAEKNNDEYDVELEKLKFGKNFKTPELKEQIWNTMMDSYNAGKTEHDARALGKLSKSSKSTKKPFVYQSGTLNFQKSGTYSSGQQIENYISRINDNKSITFTDTVGDTPVQLEYLPVRGGYQLKGSKDVISKDRLGNVIMGLPKDFSNEVEPIEPFKTKFVKSDEDLKKEQELENVYNSTSSEPIDFGPE
tara:strand:+ start:2097 stop:3605 length:1509 start_codon:yes stop_codon:yes gene_type:complete